MNAGLHFGNANTSAVICDEQRTALFPVMLLGAASVPSVAACCKGQYRFGQAARYWYGRPDAAIFRALPAWFAGGEGDSPDCDRQGAEAAERYLDYILREVCRSSRSSRLDRLVISLPDSWWTQAGDAPAVERLLQVCRGLDYLGTHQLIRESEAVCLWFAHAFRQRTCTPFQGTLLVIDCGSKALELTLTQLAGQKERPEAVSYSPLAHVSAGACAGDAYLHGVLTAAIRQVQPDAPICRDRSYWSALEQLQNEVQFGHDRLEETFDEYGLDDLSELEQEFVPLTYGRQELSITYRLLAEVYQQVAAPVLDRLLREMTDALARYQVPYLDPNQDGFQILLTGGFSGFSLVRRQIRDAFCLSTFDRRRSGRKGEQGRVSAKGAALLASGAVVLSRIAPFSIGLYVRDPDGHVCVDYAIRFRQPITFDTPYFPVSPSDHTVIKYMTASGGFTSFLLNRSDSPETALVVPVRTELLERLAHLTDNPYGTVEIGFSLAESGVISLHVRDYDLLHDTVSQRCRVIPLARYQELFEPTMVKRVIDL